MKVLSAFLLAQVAVTNGWNGRNEVSVSVERRELRTCLCPKAKVLPCLPSLSPNNSVHGSGCSLRG